MKGKVHFFSIIFVIVSLWSMNLRAQSDILFGAKAGLNVSSLGGNAAYSYDAKVGIHFGGVLEIPFSDTIMIQPEALISVQGSGGFFESNLNFWYLTIPVVAKYNVWDDLYIEAGPQLNILLSDNLDGNFYGGSGDQQTIGESNGLDFGLAVGAGYQLDDNFYFQLRFNLGFINAIKDVASKNRVFQVSAVYFL
ncbi:MAG: porin family protein [Flavobacteriaceae bacterium]